MSRKIVCLAVGALLFALSLPAQAQGPKKIPLIGILDSGTPSASSGRIEAFRQGLRQLGYVEGQNVAIEYRYADGKSDRRPELAVQLARVKADVLVAAGGNSTHARSATSNQDDSNSDDRR
jgi:putative tryptophan/tyrosine transport system substrate-binding protein